MIFSVLLATLLDFVTVYSTFVLHEIIKFSFSYFSRECITGRTLCSTRRNWFC